ncbi:helix-turn-helix domain-containing protein [Streptomyces sp. NPDC059460]|uniref:helix-turn-helix domain-containing protein n=1 Tax=Streptomyces sp. NPDC059460 TaxID=3346840 RepID=UPI0036C4CB07
MVYDPVDLMGEMFFNIRATLAEFEADLLRLRSRECVAVAWAKGKLKCKQPKPVTRRHAHLAEQHATGQHSIADLAEQFSFSRATVYRVLERARTTT